MRSSVLGQVAASWSMASVFSAGGHSLSIERSVVRSALGGINRLCGTIGSHNSYYVKKVLPGS